MKNLIILLSLTTISFISTACQPVDPNQLARERAKAGGNNNNNSQQPSVVVTNISISGAWSAACVPDPSSMYRQDSLQINGNFVTSTATYFSDSTCLKPVYLEALNGLYQLTTDPYGHTNLSVTWSKVSIAPETDAIVKIFKQERLCQFTNWATYTTQSFNVGACGLSNVLTAQIARNGSNELYLATEQYLKQ